MIQFHYQVGVFKTTATYQTQQILPDATNALLNAVVRCKYKIVRQTSNNVMIKTPLSFLDWGFMITASLSQTSFGTIVKIEGKSIYPLYLDLFGSCKKRIAMLESYV